MLRAMAAAAAGGILRRAVFRRTGSDWNQQQRHLSSSFGTVHPTAVVHRDAAIGPDVTIGPFCTIGPSVRIGSGCQLHAGSHILGDTEIGDHCIILNGAIVGADIPGRTIIGDNNIIGYHAVVGVKCQDLKYQPGEECFLFVGSCNEIREHCSVHRSSKSCDNTIIGDHNLIMGSCHIAHDCKIGNNNIFANNTLLGGHVVVENHTHTAGAVVVHQFCRLGSYCFVGGGSVISQDVPRCVMVSGERAELRGLNLEGLRRNGFSTLEVRRIRTAYQKIFMHCDSKLTFEERVGVVERDKELSESSTVTSMLQSIRESFKEGRRGICKFRSSVS